MHSRVVYAIDQQRAGYANYIISMNNGINGWFVLGILVFQKNIVFDHLTASIKIIKCVLFFFTCQVSKLYDVVQKWDAMSTSIPQVVQRLVAVKELHEQGNTQELKLLCPFTQNHEMQKVFQGCRSLLKL